MLHVFANTNLYTVPIAWLGLVRGEREVRKESGETEVRKESGETEVRQESGAGPAGVPCN